MQKKENNYEKKLKTIMENNGLTVEIEIDDDGFMNATYSSEKLKKPAIQTVITSDEIMQGDYNKELYDELSKKNSRN